MRARSIGSLLGCAVLAGLVVAGAALPLGAVVGLAAKAGSDAYEDMPTVLETPTPAQTTFVYANDGKTLLTTFYDQNRRDVALADIAPVMQQAIVAAEDTRFYEHGGVDLRGMLRAIVSDTQSGEAAQGASTLTMQYVRNVLTTDPSLTEQERIDASVDTPGRKLQEIRYAVALEKVLSKQDILNRYLNIAYFGDGAYGIAAAAGTYFSKPANALTLPEAAMLAGLVQAPDADNPDGGDQKAATSRRGYVLDAMAKMGAITADQAATAQAQPIKLTPSHQPNDCASVAPEHNDWGFFCDYFRQWWDAQPSFGATVADRDDALRSGGYNVVTSLDPGVQATALAESLKVYPYGNKRALPIAVVTPGTGRVQALAVNRHYSLDPNPPEHPKYPNTVNQLVAGGGSVTGYQSGSTFKMFTMLAALSQGKALDTSFNAPSPLVSKYRDSGPGNCGGYWCPVNDNPSWMDGQRNMWTGFGRSVNTYFVWLEEQIGPANAVAMAKKLGIQFRAPGDAALAANPQTWGAFTLGVVDTTPLDLANAYATVAANGQYCAPLPVMKITDGGGHAVAAANPTCSQVLDPNVAAAAADAARCPVGGQSAFGQCDGGTATMVAGILGGRAVAGKTGSSEHNATETFAGFTPQVAAAGIATDPDNPRDWVGSGVSAAVDIAVAKTMAAAVAGLPKASFPAPTAALAFAAGHPVRPSSPPATTDASIVHNNPPTKPKPKPNPIPVPTPPRRGPLPSPFPQN
jgi:membrane peptidoglycan carboxypeptidase